MNTTRSSLPIQDDALIERLEEVSRLLAKITPAVIGDRLRRIRIRQSLSIRDAATRARISKSSLVSIEQGASAKAITVLAVCNALGIHVNRVVEPTEDDLVIAAPHYQVDERWHDLSDFGSGPLHSADRPLTPDERRCAAEEDGAIPLCMLTSRLPEGDVLPCILELYEPTDTRSHAGQEFVYVLSGHAVITVGHRTYKLYEGESLAFRSVERHTYAPVPGSVTPARILSIRIGG